MRAIFHPQGLRPFIANWEALSADLLQRLQREALAEGETSHQLLNELLHDSGDSECWQPSNQASQNALLLTLHLKKPDLELQFFSTIATLGTPYDITLQELRIEYLFPADEVSDRHWRQHRNDKQQVKSK